MKTKRCRHSFLPPRSVHILVLVPVRLSPGDPTSATVKTAMKVVGPTTLALRKRPISSSFACIRPPKNLCLHQVSLFSHIAHIAATFVLQLFAISHSLFAFIDSDDTTLIASWPPRPTPPLRSPRLQLGGPPPFQGHLPPLPKVICPPLSPRSSARL
jgi:hypothetical protein